MVKKIIVHTFIILICAITFFSGYLHSFNAPVFAGDEWQGANIDYQVKAFQSYCKSRNLTIDGSIADAVTSFTTNIYKNLCNKIGIDYDQLQAEIKYRTDNNNRLQFLFTESGLSAYNRIFAEFLQNNDLQVGEEVENKNIYNGSYFVDDNGNACLLYVVNKYSTSANAQQDDLITIGTPYIYNTDQLIQLFDSGVTSYKVFNIDSNNPYVYLYFWGGKFGLCQNFGYGNSSPNGARYYIVNYTSASLSVRGHLAWAYCRDKNEIRLGRISLDDKGIYYWEFNFPYYRSDDSTSNIINDVDVNLSTYNNTTNNYEEINNEKTINEGDTYIINDNGQEPSNPQPPEPPTPPSYDPYPEGGGTITDPINIGGSDGVINFPNFDFNIPSIDWSIGDLRDKFPFSIPFDLVAFYTILNAEPIAPAIDSEIPLGHFYTWHFEADFSQFDNYAVLIRNVEYIGFVVTLIYITIKFVKG